MLNKKLHWIEDILQGLNHVTHVTIPLYTCLTYALITQLFDFRWVGAVTAFFTRL